MQSDKLLAVRELFLNCFERTTNISEIFLDSHGFVICTVKYLQEAMLDIISTVVTFMFAPYQGYLTIFI